MTIEDVGKFLDGMLIVFGQLQESSSPVCAIIVPINLKEQDAFHLTIEEYLLALIAMVEELVSTLTPTYVNVSHISILRQSRLAVNSVTLGDYERPLQIGNFIKDLFSGFQLLNLKNDILRKRSDGIKYSVSAWFY